MADDASILRLIKSISKLTDTISNDRSYTKPLDASEFIKANEDLFNKFTNELKHKFSSIGLTLQGISDTAKEIEKSLQPLDQLYSLSTNFDNSLLRLQTNLVSSIDKSHSILKDILSSINKKTENVQDQRLNIVTDQRNEKMMLVKYMSESFLVLHRKIQNENDERFFDLVKRIGGNLTQQIRPREVNPAPELTYIEGISPKAAKMIGDNIKIPTNKANDITGIDPEKLDKKINYGLLAAFVAALLGYTLSSLGLDMMSFIVGLGISNKIPDMVKKIKAGILPAVVNFIKNIGEGISGLITKIFNSKPIQNIGKMVTNVKVGALLFVEDLKLIISDKIKLIKSSMIRLFGDVIEDVVNAYNTVLNKVKNSTIGAGAIKFIQGTVDTLSKWANKTLGATWKLISATPAKLGEMLNKFVELGKGAGLLGKIFGGGAKWALSKLPILGLFIAIGQGVSKMLSGDPVMILSGILDIAAGAFFQAGYVTFGTAAAIGLGIEFINYLLQAEYKDWQKKAERPASSFGDILSILGGTILRLPIIGWIANISKAVAKFAGDPSLSNFGSIISNLLIGDPLASGILKWGLGFFMDLENMSTEDFRNNAVNMAFSGMGDFYNKLVEGIKQTSFIKWFSTLGTLFKEAYENPSLDSMASFFEHVMPGNPVALLLRGIDSLFSISDEAKARIGPDGGMMDYIKAWAKEKITDPFFSMIDAIADFIEKAVQWVKDSVAALYKNLPTPGNVKEAYNDMKAAEDASVESMKKTEENFAKNKQYYADLIKEKTGVEVDTEAQKPWFGFNETEEDAFNRIYKQYQELVQEPERRERTISENKEIYNAALEQTGDEEEAYKLTEEFVKTEQEIKDLNKRVKNAMEDGVVDQYDAENLEDLQIEVQNRNDLLKELGLDHLIDKDKGDSLKQELTDMAYEDYQNEQQLASQALQAIAKDAVKEGVNLSELKENAYNSDDQYSHTNLPYYNKSVEEQTKFLEESLKVSQQQAEQTRELLEFIRDRNHDPDENPVLPPPSLTNSNTYNYNFTVEGGISTFRKGVGNMNFGDKLRIQY